MSSLQGPAGRTRHPGTQGCGPFGGVVRMLCTEVPSKARLEPIECFESMMDQAVAEFEAWEARCATHAGARWMDGGCGYGCVCLKHCAGAEVCALATHCYGLMWPLWVGWWLRGVEGGEGVEADALPPRRAHCVFAAFAAPVLLLCAMFLGMAGVRSCEKGVCWPFLVQP